jgi:EGF-like domain
MRKIYISIISSILFVCCAAITACNTNPCSEVVCSNNGTCREGACACPSGFEGNFCQNKSADKFLGYWEGFRRVNGGVDVNTTLIVVPGSAPNEVIITALSFAGNYVPFKAICKLTDINIPQQTAEGASGNEYNGSGYIEKDKYIHLIYLEKNSVGITNSVLYEGTKKIIP